ncbi:MAG TPA: hypothetical protein VL156_15615 [Terriglobales bacterium]|nr:hypothetical protein [Terriglobales bacterium]
MARIFEAALDISSMASLLATTMLRYRRQEILALSLYFLAPIACDRGKLGSMQVSLRNAQMTQGDDSKQGVIGLHKLFLHDECTGEYPPQPDTCLHDRKHERSFTFAGKAGTVYDVTLRIRGIFEPTTIAGGVTPDPTHPYLKIGGVVSTPDWSQWKIEVSEPRETYWLNHYPAVAHKIYKEDFEATLAVATGATIVVQVSDGNDREIDNGKKGPDRQQVFEGVADSPLSGQMLRLDVVSVKERNGHIANSASRSDRH